MSHEMHAVLTWLVRTLAVGGGLLLIAAVMMAATRQPVRRRMIGTTAVRIALLVPLLSVAPKWLTVPLPAPVAQTPIGDASQKRELPTFSEAPRLQTGNYAYFIVPGVDARHGVGNPVEKSVNDPGAHAARFAGMEEAPAAFTLPPPSASPEPEATPSSAWPEALAVGYGLVASVLAARWLLAQIALLRLVGRSRPAGQALTTLFERVAGPGPRPELRIVPNVTGPVCCGLWRPMVLLPQRLAETADEGSLRWIFAHELAHLRRGDPWNACWFGLAAAVYFPLPWFWWLRRQVSLCQEYVADAEAAADDRAEEYAAFLVNLSRSTRRGRRLAAASAVLGSPSDLFRRITMLLNNAQRVDRCCPRRWSLLATGAFLSLAILLSGLGVARYSAAAPLDEPKEEKKDEPKKKADAKKSDKKDADQPKADPEEKFIRPKVAPRVAVPFPPGEGFDPEEFNKQMRKMMEEMQKNFPRGVFQPGGNNAFLYGGPSSGRLGVMIEKPQAALAEVLDLPKEQGLVVTEVKADSAAAKAGLKANDILLELNGKPVPSDAQEFRKQVAEIKADAAVDAVVLRKGKRETVKGLKLPEAKAENNVPFGNDFAFPVPRVPNVPLPKIAPFPAVEEGDPFAGGGKSMSIQIANDQFTVRSRDESLDITVGGTVDDGKKSVNQVKIVDGTEKHSYDKLDNVPEKYREKIDALLKNIAVNKGK